MQKKLTLKSFSMLLILAVMWGSSFTMIKHALTVYNPLSIAAGRITLAAFLIGSFAYFKGEKFPTEKADWVKLSLLAVLGNAAPFFLIAWGEHNVDGGMTAVLMSVIPLSVPIMAHFFFDDERLSLQMMIGVIIGFIGLIVLLGPSVLLGLGQDLLSQSAIVLAAFSYGFASIIARKLSHLPFLVVAGVSLSIASLIMLVLSASIEMPWQESMTWQSFGAIVYLGVFPTALANILLLKVINSSGVGFLALNNYLVPVFGVIIAALSLGESVPSEMLLSLCIIFVGIFVSNIKKRTP